MNILFITPYPHGLSPSQRFRFEQYMGFLLKKGYKINESAFFNEFGWKILYNGSFITKIFVVSMGYVNRFLLLFNIKKYDFVFIHRESTPLGPPIFEWFISVILGKKIIYDFDDAIWLEDPNEKNTFLAKIKWKSKVKFICRWSYKISVGNSFLHDFASVYNENVIINPTTIDAANYHNPDLFLKKSNKHPVIGWTGTHTTLKYLDEIIPLLVELKDEYDFEFLVISNVAPPYRFDFIKYKVWNISTEIEDLMKIDIGIMPLTDDQWSKGKCGFKLLQYMALGIPPVASPVGVNTEIIEHEINGYLCDHPEMWKNSLINLLTNTELRRTVGAEGRKKIINYYSVKSNYKNYSTLFDR